MKDIRKGVSDGVQAQERAMEMVASGLMGLTNSVSHGLSQISEELM